MNEPLYKPTTWVAFEFESEGGFGQIVGGAFDGSEWFYMISGSLDDGTIRSVPQHKITYLFQNGSWLAPTSFGGQNSAYTETNPAG
jgi:hypothetical protein